MKKILSDSVRAINKAKPSDLRQGEFVLLFVLQRKSVQSQGVGMLSPRQIARVMVALDQQYKEYANTLETRLGTEEAKIVIADEALAFNCPLAYSTIVADYEWLCSKCETYFEKETGDECPQCGGIMEAEYSE